MPLSHASNPTPEGYTKTSTEVGQKPTISIHSDYLEALALEVQHNLQYQHCWTSLCTHTYSPLSQNPLPRPLISGLPPHRIYVHPDDQIGELKQWLKEEDVGLAREWVLRTSLRENWSLRRFGEVFDGISEEPPNNGEEVVAADHQSEAQEERNGLVPTTTRIKRGKRRGGKRLLLATAGDDSTVVYYVVHDGIVKPRQN